MSTPAPLPWWQIAQPNPPPGANATAEQSAAFFKILKGSGRPPDSMVLASDLTPEQQDRLAKCMPGAHVVHRLASDFNPS